MQTTFAQVPVQQTMTAPKSKPAPKPTPKATPKPAPATTSGAASTTEQFGYCVGDVVQFLGSMPSLPTGTVGAVLGFTAYGVQVKFPEHPPREFMPADISKLGAIPTPSAPPKPVSFDTADKGQPLLEREPDAEPR